MIPFRQVNFLLLFEAVKFLRKMKLKSLLKVLFLKKKTINKDYEPLNLTLN